jgi:hypothetical protein
MRGHGEKLGSRLTGIFSRGVQKGLINRLVPIHYQVKGSLPELPNVCALSLCEPVQSMIGIAQSARHNQTKRVGEVHHIGESL